MFGTFHEYHPFLRVAGLDPTTLETLAEALAGGDLPIEGEPPSGELHAADPVQIDPVLEVVVESAPPQTNPPAGATYAGLTPAQRGAFLVWTQDAAQSASPAFQRLLMAHVEVDLLDPSRSATTLHQELARLSLAPAWRENEWLGRAMLLALWLRSNGAGIAQWTSQVPLSPDLLETAVALQALLHEQLRAEQISRLASAWHLPGADTPPDLLALGLRSLADSLGRQPLDAVREQLTEAELSPRPWRTAHRALRFAVPQPPIRGHLQPMLLEMLQVAGAVGDDAAGRIEAAPSSTPDREWRLILEFGHSRSEFYEIVVNFAQRMPGYVQLLDEDRRLVHRITIHKNEMRRFWRIWDYVQNWSTTRVYVNGQRLEQWKVWPYSQYLR